MSDGSQFRRLSEDTYKRVVDLKPNDINDLDYLERVSKALNISKKSIALVWTSEDYTGYLFNFKDAVCRLKEEKEEERRKTSNQDLLLEILKRLDDQGKVLKTILERRV